MSAPVYNLARLDLVSLRLALACAASGRLTQAAHQQHLALSAASRRLRELEEALGQRLFERGPQGLVTTAAGHVFVQHATETLASLDRLAYSLQDLSQGVARHVRLLASTAALNQFLPPLLARWATEYPAWRLEVEEQVSHVAAAELRERRADLAIFVEGVDTTGLDTRLCFEDELAVVMPLRHAQASGKAALAFERLLHEDWIGLNTGAAVLLQQQRAAQAAGQTLRLRIQVRSFDATCRLVAAGLGLALLPRAAVEPLAQQLGLRLRSLSDPWSRRRLLLAVRQGQTDEAVLAAASFLAQPVPQPSPNAKTRRRRQQ